MSKPIVLVDGSSYLYRAFHAMPSLTNSQGVPTGAIYGMINMLRRLLSDYTPSQMAIIFDAKGKTFRNELYQPYKAHRPAMPSELILQIGSIHTIIRALGIPLIMIEGVEADDVIGTLALQAKNKKQPMIISTGDKDLMQLVTEDITLINTMTHTILNPETVEEKFGLPPEKIVDYLTLIGDPVDNIPGVPQVGPKTAVKWLKEFGSLENIIKNSSQIKGKVGESLRDAVSTLPLVKSLVTIKLDVELNIEWDDLTIKLSDEKTLIKIYKELEFKTWLNELLAKNHSSDQKEKHADYEIIFTQTVFEKWLSVLYSSQEFSFVTVTTSVEYMKAKIVGLAFAIEKGKAAYLPLAHHYMGAPAQLDREAVLIQLKPLFESLAIKKIGHYLKYDYEVLANYGIKLQGIAYDTMLESYVLDSSNANHNKDTLALKYLGWRTISLEELAGKGAKQSSFDQIAVDKVAPYAAENADITLQIHQVLWPRIEKLTGEKYIFHLIEIPLTSVLARMELTGVLIDVNMLKQQSVELEKRLFTLEQDIIKYAGRPFNINSPKQLQEILFVELKLPVLQKTPTGQPSTADPVLQEMALEFELPKLIIEFRALSKLMTTYTKRLPEQINANTSRLHTSYHQSGTTTGRLASSEPNLQNIPIRTPEGRRIRQAFIVPPGYKLISADYSQIELRIMAHISEDPNLLRAFSENLDIHTATAAEIMGVPLERISYEERRYAKAVNFGLIYGMSAFGLSKQIGLSREAAQKYIDRYFARYTKVKTYMENTRAQAKQQGYVETLFGRRLHVPDINSTQIFRQKAAERAAINAPLQGTAADIIKRAMISLDHWLQTNPADAKMIMQVHDELVFEVAESQVDEFVKVISTHMMKAAELKVPLTVSIGIGDNWDAASGNNN